MSSNPDMVKKTSPHSGVVDLYLPPRYPSYYYRYQNKSNDPELIVYSTEFLRHVELDPAYDGTVPNRIRIQEVFIHDNINS
jgi:hypothetical protein